MATTSASGQLCCGQQYHTLAMLMECLCPSGVKQRCMRLSHSVEPSYWSIYSTPAASPAIELLSALVMQAMVAAPQGFNVSHMLQPALSVMVSIGLGALGGTALGMLLNAKPTAMPRTVAALTRVLPQAVIARYNEGLYVTGTTTAHLTCWRQSASP